MKGLLARWSSWRREKDASTAPGHSVNALSESIKTWEYAQALVTTQTLS